MSEKCHALPKRNDCDTEHIEAKNQYKTCPPFSVCLPFGRVLRFDGNCFYIDGTPSVVDGTYGQIVVKDGCIIGALPNPAFEYTPPPCSPAAKDCHDTDSGGNATVEIEPSQSNLLGKNSQGQLGAYLFVSSGDGVSVTGSGTRNDPLTVSTGSGGSGGGGISIMSADASVLSVTGDGSTAAPYVLTPQEVIQAGLYNGLTVDTYGRVTGMDSNATKKISAIIGGPGLSISETSGVVNIGLLNSGVREGRYDLGGYALVLNSVGQITGIDRTITTQVLNRPEDFRPQAGTGYLEDGDEYIDPYNYQFIINEYGSIAGVVPVIRGSAFANSAVGLNTDTALTSYSVNITTTVAGKLFIDWEGKKATTGNWVAPGNRNLSASYSTLNDDGNVVSTIAVSDYVMVPSYRYCGLTNTLQPGRYRATITTTVAAGLGLGKLEARIVQ